VQLLSDLKQCQAAIAVLDTGSTTDAVNTDSTTGGANTDSAATAANTATAVEPVSQQSSLSIVGKLGAQMTAFGSALCAVLPSLGA
jgi:hypothetical protein